MIRKHTPASALFVLAGTLAANAMAQSAVSLDTIVVTGTKTERKLRDVPVRTEVISAEQLNKTHARDLVEALEYQPGISLQKIHGKSGYEVIMQGVGGDRVLILVDGLPVSSSTGSTADLSQLSVSGIDRIEIVKGAVSSLYGSAAMGGVINVITKTPEKGVHYELTADFGSWGDKDTGYGKAHFKTVTSYRDEKLTAIANIDIRDSGGFDLDKDTYSMTGDEGSKINLNFDLKYQIDTHQSISYKPSFYFEDVSKDTATFRPGVGFIKGRKTETVDKTTHVIRYTKNYENESKLSAYFMVENFEGETAQDKLATSVIDALRTSDISFSKAEIQYDFDVSDNHLFTTGFVVFESELKQLKAIDSSQPFVSETTGKPSHDNLEFYLQDNIFLNDQWELVPGIRIQEDSGFGSYTAARINAMYTPDIDSTSEIRVRFGVGQGYRVPDLKERYFKFDHRANGYIILGSQVKQWEDTDLNTTIDFGNATVAKPEESLSFQWGIEIINDDKSRIDFSLYQNDISNLIESLRYSGPETAGIPYAIYRYANVANAKTQGFDVSWSKPITDNFYVDTSYGYLKATNEDTGKELKKRPRHKVNINLDWKLPKLKSNIIIRAKWQSEEWVNDSNTTESPAWHALDIKYNYALNKNSKLFVGIDNITNQHKDPANQANDRRPEEGRFIYVGYNFFE